MAVKLRLQRAGTKKKPFYKVIAVDCRVKRDGQFIEQIGKYQPISGSDQFIVNEEKILGWLKLGAQPTNTIYQLLKKKGIWKKHQTGQ